MANSERREATVGALTVAILAAVIGLAAAGTSETTSGADGGMTVSAQFGRIDGLAIGAPVRMAGLDIGEIAAVSLSDQRRALVTLVISDADIEIPTDSAAVIETDGIFGEKYIEIHPGGEFDALTDGDRLSYSQDSVVLETLLNQIVARARASRDSEPSESP